MGAKKLDELRAYLAARAFKLEVYAIIDESPSAQRDFGFLDQLRDAVAGGEANVAEGFGRYLAGDFTRFLRIARGCVDEAMGWLQDGVDRRHFRSDRCAHAHELGIEARRLITALITSLQPFTRKNRQAAARRPKSNPRRRPRATGRTPSRGRTSDPGRTPDSARTPDPGPAPHSGPTSDSGQTPDAGRTSDAERTPDSERTRNPGPTPDPD
jgi:four helix bundle protein